MLFSRKQHPRREPRIKSLVAISLIIGMMFFPISSAQAAVGLAGVRFFLDSATNLLLRLPMPKTSWESSDPRSKSKQAESAGQRESRVARISICPRRVLMYVGEQHSLSPLPLDSFGDAVHGVAFSYESSAAHIADVTTDGSVTALKPGEGFVTAMVGQRSAKVRVEVRDGLRPRLTNAQWDSEHAHDCGDPELDASSVLGNLEFKSSRNFEAKPSVSAQLPVPDDDPPPNLGAAASRENAVGHPRFSPALALQASPASTDNQLGSYSYNLSIPVFGAGGRGVGVDLNLVYNSRVWTKSFDTMAFDYDVGWPAPGFRLNYGRIIPDYNVPSGSLGDYLLIEGDGTRTHLANKGGGLYRSDDGRYIEFVSSNNKLFLPNGTLVRYEVKGPNKILPTSIRDSFGNSITIAYVESCQDALRVEPCTCGSGCSKPPRQAIKQITDTLGRFLTFYYTASGQLAEIRSPGYSGGPDRVVAKFSYETRTLTYDFGSLTVVGVPVGGQLDVLKRVYFPETGRGYIFGAYSGYGMSTNVSMRIGMTDVLDGTETGYTEYAMQTTGVLSDSPQFTERREWWHGKTDDLGNATTVPATYVYSRTTDGALKTMTNSVTGPAGPNSVTTIMVSDNDTFSLLAGLLKEQRLEVAGLTRFKQEYTYDNPSSGPGSSGLQRNKVTTTDDGGLANQTRTDFAYGQYGRLISTTEHGFPNAAGNFRKRRRTVYSYLDTPNHIAAALYRLVTFITVWDAKETNDDSDDTRVAKTSFDYDSPDSGWETQQYGFTTGCKPPACTPPPGYDTSFVGASVRGLVTKVLRWSDATLLPDISFRRQYDIFGNELKAEVSCCSVRASIFGADFNHMFYSVPVSITDGGSPGPSMTTAYSYDPNTGFLNSTTDPNNLTTSYAPDSAMRRRTVTYPKLAGDPNPNPTLETFYADANNNPSAADTLVYQSRFRYLDGTQQRVQISNQWLDGTGRTLRAGLAAGPITSSYDAVKSIYDETGRLRKSTNPYNTPSSNGDTSGLPNATSYDYDGLGRVISVTLPDSNTVTTTFTGALTTVTDQVGRQRRTEVDGLGRTIRVTEMDANKQLTQDTLYGYDKNDNLTSVDQGGQLRAFKYDSLSRLRFERTPEQDATINDGNGVFWSAKYTYTGFDALLTRQDARGVVVTYGYDGLNRLSSVSYSTAGTSALSTAAVSVTYGSVAPTLGRLMEVKKTSSPSGTPWKENYEYDALSRLSSRIVSLSNQTFSYATSYGYNQAGQLKTMTYPSSRLVNVGYDSRGRVSSLGGSRSYINSVGYSSAQQTTTINLANGVNESYGYNPQLLQLTSQSATKGATSLMNLAYSYTADQSRNGGTKTGNSDQLMDMTGNIINSGIKDQSFGYDQMGRLVQASGFGVEDQWQRRYTYDRWSNRTKVESSDTGAWCTKQTMSFKRGPGGEPLSNRATEVQDYFNCNPAASKAMAYNETGDVTGYGIQKYLYDGESRLVQVLDNAGGSWQYTYDAANRRVTRVGGGMSTNYVWEGGRVIAEYNGVTGTLLAEYIYAGDRLLAREAAGTVTYYHPDRLSTRMLTDVAGNWVGTQSHEPFGEQVEERDLTNKWRFTNYERDSETGSDYAVNRQYQTGAGRFMRPDPISGGDPQSLNRYVYVDNDPVNSADPLGLLACYLSYSYQYFSTTTVDGEDAVGIRVVATQTCWGGVGSGASGGSGIVIGGEGGGGGGSLGGERVGGPMTPNQCLRDCYRKALDAYDIAGKTSDQQSVDFFEGLSPVSAYSAAGGIDEFVKVLKGGPAFVTSKGLQGPVLRGSIRSALKAGGSKAVGGVLGKVSLGAGLGGLLIQVLNPFIGREKFIRDAIDECNSGCRGATRKIGSSVFGTVGRVRDFLSRP